jgi:hypothetical protein
MIHFEQYFSTIEFMKPFFAGVITTFILCAATNAAAQIEVNWLHNVKAGKYSQVMDFIHADSAIYLSLCSKGAIENTEYSSNISEDDTQTSLIKLDEAGNVIWKNSVISKETRITNIAKAPDGNIIAVGYSNGETKFSSANQTRVVNSTENYFLFISYYKADGKLIKLKIIEQKKGRRALFPTSVAINSAGDLYMSLNYYGVLINNGTAIEKTKKDKEFSAILKFSKHGEFIEIVNQWEIIGTRAQVDVKIDTENHLIISGYSRGEVHLSDEVVLECSEGNIYAENTSFSFVAKYGLDHQLLWYQKIGGRNNQMITDMVVSKKNEIYVCGTFTFECIFSNDIATNNTAYERRFESSMFYAKLKPEGELSFVKYCRSTGGNSCHSGRLAIDENDYIHLTGSYNGMLNFNSSGPIRIGEILKGSPTPKSNWQVNTRGNSAWFYSVWKDDINLYCQNLYDLNGYPDAQYVRELVAYDETILMGGFYHIGKPSLISSPKNIELQASGDSGMYAVFVSSGIPHLPMSTYTETKTKDTADHITTVAVEIADNKLEQQIEINRPVNGSLTTTFETDAKVNVFPNPTKDYVNIELNHFSEWVNLMLVSETGAVIHSQSISQVAFGESLQLNMASLSSGTYYLVVISTNFRHSYPIVKAR